MHLFCTVFHFSRSDIFLTCQKRLTVCDPFHSQEHHVPFIPRMEEQPNIQKKTVMKRNEPTNKLVCSTSSSSSSICLSSSSSFVSSSTPSISIDAIPVTSDSFQSSSIVHTVPIVSSSVQQTTVSNKITDRNAM